ncbi:helix-turn-helix domain-containing protein [Dysgonomonas sp. 25]|uniref:helix-turn-helix domain-containing protein n=1 Tax=Dysgonomonas sp. 25 TaxID=2302933 RepID=UPI0013CFFB52|nr:helix-turn-helix transcriptional regulator [Dysgonomonas sp. 25]NDV67544.1 helix-turn-helix domain-containing protein [Dysgonomonas sp. 25]
MRERIRLIMENEQLTPSAFADMLDIGRAVISHILNGRNNPSLDVATRILSKLPYVNSDWLLTGNGEMYKPGTDRTPLIDSHQETPAFPTEGMDLFSQAAINPMERAEKTEYRKENIVNTPENVVKEPIKQEIIYQKAPEKKITKIIVYYSDNTFETFEANK